MRVSDYDHARNRGNPLAGPPAMAEENPGVYASGKNKEHFRGTKVERERNRMTIWLRNYMKKLFLRSLDRLQGGFLEVVCPEATYSFGDPGAQLRAMAVIHDERLVWS
jgi:hypothetical protein